MDKLADENTRIKLAALRMLISIWSLDKNCISLLIEELCEVNKSDLSEFYWLIDWQLFNFSFKIAKMKNWRSRVAAIQIIKNFCIFNIFLLDEETKELMRELAISLVVDENLEVRSSTCLSGFFHSSFIDVDSDLIVTLIIWHSIDFIKIFIGCLILRSDLNILRILTSKLKIWRRGKST